MIILLIKLTNYKIVDKKLTNYKIGGGIADKIMTRLMIRFVIKLVIR